MLISKTQMQNIVDEMKKTLHKNINIMDETGCIIASTDISRIGMYHFGAQKIISQKLDELVICENDLYEGARNGINLPIVIDHEIVGVVGITGEREEVAEFGKIIQKMSEIMILDRYQRNYRQTTRDMRNNFVFNWLFDNREDRETEEELKMSGSLLGIDVELPRVVTILNILYQDNGKKRDERSIQLQRQFDGIIRQIDDSIGRDEQQIVLQIGNKIIIFFHNDCAKWVLNKINLIARSIERQYGCSVYGGIGTLGADKNEIRRSYREANMACDMAFKIKNQKIKVYSDIDMEMLLQIIPNEERISFFKKVLKNCFGEELGSWMQLLRCFVENNGSITQTADMMFIHKNTLQYRLNKLKCMTDYDPRNIKDSVPLYIAMLIYEMDFENMKF